MRLRTINTLLRAVGFVLVVTCEDDGPATYLNVERARTYDARNRRADERTPLPGLS